MGTLEYSLVPGGKKRLKLSFSGLWEKAAVDLDGETIWTMESKAQLERGHLDWRWRHLESSACRAVGLRDHQLNLVASSL